MGMLDAERVDRVAELGNPIRKAEDKAVPHRPVFVEVTMLSGRKDFFQIKYLGTKGEFYELIRHQMNEKNANATHDCCVSAKIPYKVKKENFDAFELPFTIEYEHAEPTFTKYDVAKNIFDSRIPKLQAKLADAKECYEATANHSRMVEAHELWGEQVNNYEREIEKLTEIWSPLLLADDIQECADEDRRYKAKEQANQVIFNENK